MANQYNFTSTAGAIGDALHDMLAERELQRQKQVEEERQAALLKISQDQEARLNASAKASQKIQDEAATRANETALINEGKARETQLRPGDSLTPTDTQNPYIASQAAAPAMMDIVKPETDPAKQQGIFPGIIAQSAPSVGDANAAPGKVFAGTAQQRAQTDLADAIKTNPPKTRAEAYALVTRSGAVPPTEIDNFVDKIFPKDVVPKPPTAEEDKAKAIDITSRMAQGKPVTSEEIAWNNAFQKVSTQGTRESFVLNTPVRDTARSDRSYAANKSELEAGYKPIADQLDRMGRLTVSVNQETPQADALIAPELLTAMAGGMGSGLRMNESEIARIVGGRSALENLKAAFQHFNPDDKKALSITPEQRTQIRSLIGAMQEKLLAKQEAYASARRALAEADTVDEQRKVANDLKDTLAKIDNPPAPKVETGGAGDTTHSTTAPKVRKYNPATGKLE